MARLAAAGVALAALAAAPLVAAAQPLPSLHVRNFSLALDRTRIRVGEPLRLTITVDVAEKVPQIAGVVLPNLAGFDELGDERRCTSAAAGTTCVETLTLEPTGLGTRTLGPATLDAVDARSGKPSRFATNSVVVRVDEAGGISGDSVREGIYGFADLVIRVALVLLVVVLGAALIARLFRRRPAAPIPKAVFDPQPLNYENPRAPAAVAFPELVAALEREPSRANAVALRDALRARVGAGERETQRDLDVRGAISDPRESAGMGALERAAFCPGPDVERYAKEAALCLK